MGKYHIKTTKTVKINGTEYSTEINQDVNIDFSAAGYSLIKNEDGREIELVPDNMDFLHELTDIFPLSEYDIKITQNVYGRHIKQHVSLYLDIENKENESNVYLADNALLSDGDYEYIQNILAKELPEYKWQSAEKYLRSCIEQYLGDCLTEEIFTNDAFHFLSRMTSARYREYKMDGYVDFDDDKMLETAKLILETALGTAYETDGVNNAK